MRNKLIKKIVTLGLAAVMVISSGAAVFGASYISRDAAISKALKSANTTRSAVWALECERDRDDGVKVYDVRFFAGNTEYDFEIDAINGTVLKYEKNTIMTQTSRQLSISERLKLRK